jgi:hypothetical protein
MDDKVATDVATDASAQSDREVEVEAFVEWFCAYWRSRGAGVFAERLDGDCGADGNA